MTAFHSAPTSPQQQSPVLTVLPSTPQPASAIMGHKQQQLVAELAARPSTAPPRGAVKAAANEGMSTTATTTSTTSMDSPREASALPVPGVTETPVRGDGGRMPLHVDFLLTTPGATTATPVSTSSTATPVSTSSTATPVSTSSTATPVPSMTATPFQSALTERAAEENIKAMLASAAKAAAAKVEAETATAAVPSVSGAVSSPAVPSVATTSTQPQHHPVEYSFAWSVATQKGYRYANTFSRAASTKLDIHEHMEDMHYPAQEQTPNNVHPLTGQTYQLFMLADGHGGHACARFAIERLPPAIITLVNSRLWNLRDRADQQELRASIQKLFLAIDTEYCERKLEEFRAWIRPIVAARGNPNDQQHRPTKPADDGCTLVVNLLYDGYLVNCNVGDSRSLLLRSEQGTNDWSTAFASIDHTPGHPAKAHQIHTNGGRYMINGATMDISYYMQGFNLGSWNGVVVHESEAYDYLSRCRIGRQAGWRISEIDVQACTTLNLTGTMGDLFFKYQPALISACPDVTFTALVPLIGRRYMLVMATDGLWDHMREQMPAVQQAMVAEHVRTTMDVRRRGKRGAGTLSANQAEEDLGFYAEDAMDSATTATSSSDDEEEREIKETLQRLGVLAHGLCDREMSMCKSDLFAPGFIRYDDCTAFVVMVDGPAVDMSDDDDDDDDNDDERDGGDAMPSQASTVLTAQASASP